jgi:stage II sporulation protein D
LTHVLIESHAKTVLPLWFREGLVLWLTAPRSEPPASGNLGDLNILDNALERPRDEAELRRAYDAARGAIERLVRMHGKETVVGWVEKGMPRDLDAASGSRPR